MQPKIEFVKPRDFGEIINDTFIFVRQNFKPLMKYFFILCGFFILASGATSLMNQLRLISSLEHYSSNSFAGDNPGFSFLNLGYFVNIFFAFLEYTAITVTVLCYIILYKQNGNKVPRTEEMWGYFKFYYLKILGSSFVLLILLVAGFVFCLIPGIYLYPIFALIPAIMIFENTSFGYAFNQSFRLIKDNWWLTFGALVIIFIVIYVASIVVAVPATILYISNTLAHIGKGSMLSTVIVVITTLLEQIAHIFHILSIVTIGLCYFSLNESKEGTGLLERISQFGNIKPEPEEGPENY